MLLLLYICPFFRVFQDSFIDVESLSAFTPYKFLLNECDGAQALYNEFDLQTKHDGRFHLHVYSRFVSMTNVNFSFIVLGSITNHKIYRKEGIVLEWGEPKKLNDVIDHYLIEWTISNVTFSAKINYNNSTKNVFKVRKH